MDFTDSQKIRIYIDSLLTNGYKSHPLERLYKESLKLDESKKQLKSYYNDTRTKILYFHTVPKGLKVIFRGNSMTYSSLDRITTAKLSKLVYNNRQCGICFESFDLENKSRDCDLKCIQCSFIMCRDCFISIIHNNLKNNEEIKHIHCPICKISISSDNCLWYKTEFDSLFVIKSPNSLENFQQSILNIFKTTVHNNTLRKAKCKQCNNETTQRLVRNNNDPRTLHNDVITDEITHYISVTMGILRSGANEHTFSLIDNFEEHRLMVIPYLRNNLYITELQAILLLQICNYVNSGYNTFTIRVR